MSVVLSISCEGPFCRREIFVVEGKIGSSTCSSFFYIFLFGIDVIIIVAWIVGLHYVYLVCLRRLRCVSRRRTFLSCYNSLYSLFPRVSEGIQGVEVPCTLQINLECKDG